MAGNINLKVGVEGTDEALRRIDELIKKTELLQQASAGGVDPLLSRISSASQSFVSTYQASGQVLSQLGTPVYSGLSADAQAKVRALHEEMQTRSRTGMHGLIGETQTGLTQAQATIQKLTAQPIVSEEQKKQLDDARQAVKAYNEELGKLNSQLQILSGMPIGPAQAGGTGGKPPIGGQSIAGGGGPEFGNMASLLSVFARSGGNPMSLLMGLVGAAGPFALAGAAGYAGIQMGLSTQELQARGAQAAFQLATGGALGINPASMAQSAIMRTGMGTYGRAATDPRSGLRYLLNYITSFGDENLAFNRTQQELVDITRQENPYLEPALAQNLRRGEMFHNEERIFGAQRLRSNLSAMNAMGVTDLQYKRISEEMARHGILPGAGDRSLMKAQEFLNVSDRSIREMIRVGRGDAGTQLQQVRALMGMAGLTGVESLEARGILSEAVAAQSEMFGTRAGLGGVGAYTAGVMGRMMSPDVISRVSMPDAAKAAVEAAQRQIDVNRAPGSIQYTNNLAMLAKMGITNMSHAQAFIDMGLQNPETRRKISEYLRTAKGVDISQGEIGAQLQTNQDALMAQQKKMLLSTAEDQTADEAFRKITGFGAAGFRLAGTANPAQAMAAEKAANQMFLSEFKQSEMDVQAGKVKAAEESTKEAQAQADAALSQGLDKIVSALGAEGDIVKAIKATGLRQSIAIDESLNRPKPVEPVTTVPKHLQKIHSK